MLITMLGSSRNRGWNVIVRMSEISMNILLRSSLREGFFDIVKVWIRYLAFPMVIGNKKFEKLIWLREKSTVGGGGRMFP